MKFLLGYERGWPQGQGERSKNIISASFDSLSSPVGIVIFSIYYFYIFHSQYSTCISTQAVLLAKSFQLFKFVIFYDSYFLLLTF